ncbi:hypothetical protein ACHHYP_08951 [Achlya hypogyna]|uniref:PX domain-containing protein n=1 Tax=Achlya hypogyna TaxID=1202772 RepID=A0A1V9ZJU7_ACHHY|nr:hypothetical protein ACHHYP_08951 [Achlya hypogyna]
MRRLSGVDALGLTEVLFDVAVVVPVPSTPTVYEFTVGFGLRSSWTVRLRYSALRSFRNSLRSLAHKARCHSDNDTLLALLEFEFPSRQPFQRDVGRLVATRTYLLQHFVSRLFNLHAHCLMESCARPRAPCAVAIEIRRFFQIDTATTTHMAEYIACFQSPFERTERRSSNQRDDTANFRFDSAKPPLTVIHEDAHL